MRASERAGNGMTAKPHMTTVARMLYWYERCKALEAGRGVGKADERDNNERERR